MPCSQKESWFEFALDFQVCIISPMNFIDITEAALTQLDADLRKTVKPKTTARYKIVRFHRDMDSQVVARGLTLEEAQAHCRRDDTKGNGWFDGYEQESK